MSYLGALKMEYQARAQRKAGEQIEVGLVRNLPLFRLSIFEEVMEGPCLWNLDRDIFRKACEAFYKQPVEWQQAMLDIPEGPNGDQWHSRWQEWEALLRPALQPGQHRAAMDAISRHYWRCIARRESGC